MKKVLSGILIVMLIICVFSSCSKKDEKMFSKLEDFQGAKIGSVSGTVFDLWFEKYIPNVENVYFNTFADKVAAVKSGKIDALGADMPVAKLLVNKDSDLMIFPETVAEDVYGFAIKKNSPLKDKCNEAIQKLKADGTLTAIEEKWFSSDESKKTLPTLDYKSDFDGSVGTLTYACESQTEPMCYIGEGGKPTGLDIDVISRVAYELNMKLEILQMNNASLLPSVDSGKADLCGGCMSITEERLKSVDFAGPYLEGGIVLVIKKDRFEEK